MPPPKSESRAVRLRNRVYTLLERSGGNDPASTAVDMALMLLILANGVVSIAQTVPGFWESNALLLNWFELFSVTVFSVEYLLRVWSCTAQAGTSSLGGRLRFMLRPLILIDFIAILPFFMQFLGADLRMMRLIRLIRIVRLAKLGRYSRALRILLRAFLLRRDELLMTLMLGMMALILSATLMYYAENAAQPKIFSSIPASFWWAMTTLTTVGYGDTYPITLIGRIVGGVVQIIGVGLFALPTGILASAFWEELQGGRLARMESARQFCPHCGEALDTGDDHEETGE